MYCPSCGSEERQLSQYCRACGTDLRVVRSSLERPDAITASAISAREQIGMAVADQIRQMNSAKELNKIAENVLPAFEKFVESPEEKRLRRVRAGVIMSAIGLGATIAMCLMVLGMFPAITPGLITFSPFLAISLIIFFTGIGVILNGLLFTLPRKQLPGNAADALSQRALDLNRVVYDAAPSRTNELNPTTQTPAASITEHTTHHLSTSKP